MSFSSSREGDEAYWEQLVQAAQQRLERIRQDSANPSLPSPDLQAEAITELSIALEELQVASEELQLQNEELLATRQAVEWERHRYQTLFELAPDGYLVTDDRALVQEANRAAATLLNIPQKYLVGKPLDIFVVSADRDRFSQELRRLRADTQDWSDLEPPNSKLRPWELRLQPRHSKPFPALFSVSASCDCQDGSVRLLWSIRDITALKQAQEILRQANAQLEIRVEARTTELAEANLQLQCELKERQQAEANLRAFHRRWHRLLDHVRLLVVGLDIQGRVEYVNPFFLELTGYTEAEVLGSDWIALFLPSSQQQVWQTHLLDLLEHNTHCHSQTSILIQSGEERIIAWNQTRLQNFQGEAIGLISIGEDITQRYAIERMKDEFISVVSHELRTPLTSIHGALNLLSTGLVAPHCDRGNRLIQVAAENTQRLVRLVNDILELERLESGKIKLRRQRLNAADLVYQAMEQMQPIANGAKVTLECEAPTIELDADGDRIIQVLTNLLDNAIKFSPRGSIVELSVERHPPSPSSSPATISPATILFAVKDRGRGIPADKIDRIFDRFHQVDASDSREKGGTGLGLAICRSIVEQHGGKIWVESRLDKGSSFYLTIPV